MAGDHLVAGREVGRDDSRKLFGRGVAGGREHVVDAASVDRRDSNRFADRRLEVGAAVADDYAAPFIGRASIGLRLRRGPGRGASPGLRAYRIWMIEHPADDSRISSPIVKAVLRP